MRVFFVRLHHPSEIIATNIHWSCRQAYKFQLQQLEQHPLEST